jgi:4-hydroxy-3-methylbut-2-enyl diphosphate reductase
MRRFHPTPRAEALPHKVLMALDGRRFRPSTGAGVQLRIASALGMDADAREALERLSVLGKTRKTGVAGRFMPDAGVSARLAAEGIAENVEPADYFRFRTIATPYTGISTLERREWEEVGQTLEDLTSPQILRARESLGVVKLDGGQCVVIGRHEDPESLAISGGSPGTRIVEDTTDTARLQFSPTFGVVCQPTLSPRKVSWLVQQLRLRWKDARIRFLDTVSPAMSAREDALERLMSDCDRVVIVGETGESSCSALSEAALRHGKPSLIVASADDLEPQDFRSRLRTVLTAGAFATDEKIRGVAAALALG